MPSSHAVAVLLITPEGAPLIRDPKKPSPVYWKLPGGRSEEGETPEAAAIREVREELGIELKEDDLFLIHEEDRGSHTLTIFRTERPDLHDLRSVGNEGEEVRIFPLHAIATMADFFPNHRAIVAPFLKDQT